MSPCRLQGGRLQSCKVLASFCTTGNLGWDSQLSGALQDTSLALRPGWGERGSYWGP